MVDITVLLQKAPCPTSLLKRIDKYWGSKSQNLSLQRRHRSDTLSLSREARKSHGKAAHPKSRTAISDKQMGNTTLKVLGWSQSGPTPGRVQATSYCTKSWSGHWRCAKFPHQQPAGWWGPYFSGPSHQKRVERSVERWQGQSRRNTRSRQFGGGRQDFWVTWAGALNRSVHRADLWNIQQARLSLHLWATYDTLPCLWYHQTIM